MVNIKSFILIFCLWSSTAYTENQYIDVVIACHEKDMDTLELSIAGIKNNVRNVRRIIVVSAKRLTNNVEWFDEALYPFSKRDIMLEIFQDTAQAESYMEMKNNRVGWIFQQFLKLYALFVIPDISDNVLIVDSDTIFLKPLECISAEGDALFAVGTEYHKPYFEHGKRLIPGFKRVFLQHSGIVHHNFFQRHIMQDMFAVIEQAHGVEAWKAIARCIDKNDLKLGAISSCMSEYELYFNFVFSGFYKAKLRPLKWKDIRRLSAIEKARKKGFDYVSCHKHSRLD